MTIGRWTRSIVAKIDGIITQVENHEALAESAIAEFELGAARARTRLSNLKHDAAELRRALHDESEAVGRWRERAAREPDDAQALECLRRSHGARRQMQELARQVAEHERIERRLARDSANLEVRLSELRCRKSALHTRQSRAAALQAIQLAETPPQEAISDALERWETLVLDSELEQGCDFDRRDLLDEAYADAEEAALALELAELRRETR